MHLCLATGHMHVRLYKLLLFVLQVKCVSGSISSIVSISAP